MNFKYLTILGLSSLTLHSVQAVNYVPNCEAFTYAGVIIQADGRTRGEEMVLPKGQGTTKGWRVRLTKGEMPYIRNPVPADELLWHPDKTSSELEVNFDRTTICFNKILVGGLIPNASVVRSYQVPRLSDMARDKVQEAINQGKIPSETINRELAEDVKKDLDLSKAK